MNGSFRRLAVAALVVLTVPLAAQQDVPMNGNTPRAPQGIKIPPLPEAPVRFETGEGQTIRVAGAGAPRPRPAAGGACPAGACPGGACAIAGMTAHRPSSMAPSEAAVFFNIRRL